MASWAYTRHIERTLEAQGGHRMLSSRETLERRIVFALCEHLQHEGFELIAVYDGEEAHPATTSKGAVELIFSFDEAALRVKKPGANEHGVLLIMGNGEDVVSDWSYTDGDPDGFDAAMNTFLVRIGELF